MTQQSQSSSLVVVGSIAADFVAGVARFPRPGETVPGTSFLQCGGGKGANQAYACGKLGGAVAMVGRVGNDGNAGWVTQNLANAGVDVRHVSRDPNVMTGTAVVITQADGQNEAIIVAGSNNELTVPVLETHKGAIDAAKVVLLQLEIPMPSTTAAAAWARAARALVVLDPGPARPLTDALLADVDYLTPNETELAILTGQPVREVLSREDARAGARSLLERGARNVIVKMGAAGALWVHGAGEHFWPSFKVKAVDTVAAGDCWNAAFAVMLAQGRSVVDAGHFACAAAAVCVTRAGSTISMPTRAEAEALMARS